MGSSYARQDGFYQMEGNQGCQKKSGDLPEIKQNFVFKFLDVVSKHQIPADMVVNWDQTGVRMVPSGNWTMEKERVLSGCYCRFG